jgi:hypothetical protein
MDTTNYPPELRDMREWADEHDDMPDGAFFALAEETMSWGIEDWVKLANYEANNGVQ